MTYDGSERRSNPHCMEHSGIIQQLKNIEDGTRENKSISQANCKKLDAIKTWIMITLGGMVVSLTMQVIGKL